MKKRAALLILCLLMALPLVSCGHIEDTNGDTDFTLGTIDDQRIVDGVSSYTQQLAVKSEKNNVITYKASKFTGVNVLKKVSHASQIIIKSDITVESGNFRVVVIQNDEIIKDLPFGSGQVTTIEGPGEDYEIRIAGESAKFNLRLEYEVSK